MVLLKKKNEVLDLVELQKRGLLQKQEQVSQGSTSYTDLTGQLAESTPNPLGFLDSLAGAHSVSSSTASISGSTDIADIKVKLDDFEYKLDRFMERLLAIESKLKEFENETT